MRKKLIFPVVFSQPGDRPCAQEAGHTLGQAWLTVCPASTFLHAFPVSSAVCGCLSGRRLANAVAVISLADPPPPPSPQPRTLDQGPALETRRTQAPGRSTERRPFHIRAYNLLAQALLCFARFSFGRFSRRLHGQSETEEQRQRLLGCL